MKNIIFKWFRRYRLHVLLWLLFISYESIVIGLITGVFGNPITYVTHYTLILFLFYIHSGLSLPWALKSNQSLFWRLPLIILFEIIAFDLTSFFLDKLLNIVHVLNSKDFSLTYQYTLSSLYRGIYFMGFSTGYYFIVRFNREKRLTNKLEKRRLNDIIIQQKSAQELTKAQNAFLKAQINPHLLFNTLDYIYHNIVSSSPPAADAVITLAEMMRFAIDSDKMGDFILLGDEIDQAENLLYLNQIRKNDKLNFRLIYGEDVRNIHLIPLVLLTLVENIFKHGNLDSAEHPAVVNIYLTDKAFFMETDNLIDRHKKSQNGHAGLFNIKNRLNYAYGRGLIFNYGEDEENHFKLAVSIPLESLIVPDGILIALKGNGRERPHANAGSNQTTG